MAILLSTTTAEGEIGQAFASKGRGWVLALKEGFSGSIHRGGCIESARGSVAYTGPDVMDANTAQKSWVVVFIDEASKEHFPIGEKVTFYRSM